MLLIQKRNLNKHINQSHRSYIPHKTSTYFYHIKKLAIELKPNTYQYPSPELEANIQLASLLLRHGGLFCLAGKHLPQEKKIGLIVVEVNHTIFHHLSERLKEDEDKFELAV